jgi:hypothetical protein
MLSLPRTGQRSQGLAAPNRRGDRVAARYPLDEVHVSALAAMR